jgi:hypothetical protein
MRLKFPDLTQVHAQFENPNMLKLRASEISKMASQVIKKVEDPKLFRRLKERILQVWSA